MTETSAIAPTDEIEITSEMIAAGEDVLLCELGGAVCSHWHPDALANAVYLAKAGYDPRRRTRFRQENR